MLSNTCKYAIRACIYLALEENRNKIIGIKEISKALNIPTPFLGKILQVLAKNKILRSVKGPNGGFSFAVPPQKVMLMDIVNIIDGGDFFDSCLIGVASCSSEEEHCPIHPKYSPLREELKKLFIEQDIQSLADEIHHHAHKVFI
jgi:Rrf2 family protein